MTTPKIGEIVRANLPQILEYCANDDPEEIVRLSDRQYCKEVLGLGYPFLCTPAEADLIKTSTGHSRYWASVHQVLGHDVRVTSMWLRSHLTRFVHYLADKGLEPVGLAADVVEAELAKLATPAVTTTSPGGARYRIHAIGNAQNSAVRNVLGSLGKESFTEKDWLGVKRWFGFRCAYCGSRHQLVMDHAVPISTAALGEHRLGNLVPACHDCNSDKGMQRYDDYLREQRDRADATARLATITQHMSQHGYRPLTDVLSPESSDQVRALVQQLRSRVAEAAALTVAAINDEIAPSAGSASAR